MICIVYPLSQARREDGYYGIDMDDGAEVSRL